MLSSSLGIGSLGQFPLGSVPQGIVVRNLIRAPCDRTFYIPQEDDVWRGDKTPIAIENFSFDWTKELGGCCSDSSIVDTIFSSQWVVESSEISVVAFAIDATSKITTVLISGGIANNVYNVTNIINTESGLKLTATFRLFINEYNW